MSKIHNRSGGEAVERKIDKLLADGHARRIEKLQIKFSSITNCDNCQEG